MKATDILSYLKRVIRGLIILNAILVVAIIIIVCSFLHYLSLYDFTDNVSQNVKDIETIENSSIQQNS